jgi:manganese efflux pump family protein
MDTITILLVAVGLSMDAFAVSISSAVAIDRIKFKHALKVGAFFGSFQAFMPLLGWLAGFSFRVLITGIDHWIAFALLALIGGKMIFESFKKDCPQNKMNPLDNIVLLGLAVATSIDALAAGISFALLKINILYTVSLIGLITFIVSMVGVFLGKKLCGFWGKKIEIAGGMILIGIGLKILIEHTLQ